MQKKNRDSMGKSDVTLKQKVSELEQEKIILETINKSLEENSQKSDSEKQELIKELEKLKHYSKEVEMTKKILEKSSLIAEQKNQRISKKHIVSITLMMIVLGGGFMGFQLFVSESVGQEYEIDNLNKIKSNYIIQNLRGDTIDTWLSWRIVEGTVLHVNIIDSQKYPEKTDLIKKVVMSEEGIEIDNSLLHKGPKGTTSLYYVGWTGALKAASENPTKLHIPNDFKVIESNLGEGDITIRLTESVSGDGYSGFTKSIADESQNQILKSEITIYQVDKLSNEQFESILRHELGHALGLAHSSAPEDLMHPTIETGFPYISECNIDAIVSLYDGGKKSEVVCKS